MVRTRKRILWKILAILWLTVGFSVSLLAQNNAPSDSLRIDRILVTGNKKTKRYIIVRELGFHPGDVVSRHDLQLAKERIFNLYLFNSVEFHILPFSSETVLKIAVVERWSLFPIPILEFHEHSFSRVSYGGGVADYNFLGRAQRIFFLGWAGFNPGGRIAYENNWFGGDKRLFAFLNVGSMVEINHTKQFSDLEARVSRAYLRFGKRLDPYRWTGLVVKVERLKFSNSRAALSSSGTDRILSAGLHFQWDTRDWHEYPSRGYFVQAEFVDNWILGEGQFHRGKWDVRHYQPLGGLILAGRFAATWLRGTVPVYKHIFLGYDRRIRGHFRQTAEGKARALASFSVRFPLVQRRFVNLSKQLPALQKLEFGLYGALFADGGVLWSGNPHWGTGKTLRGAGIGLNFILPYSSVLRTEYAWDENFQGEFILDMRAAF